MTTAIGEIARWVRRRDRGSGLWVLMVASFLAALAVTTATAYAWGLHHEQARLDAITPTSGGFEEVEPDFYWSAQQSEYKSRPVLTTLVAAAGNDAALTPPPGVAAFPREDEAYISPAMADAIEADPTLAGRVPGRVIGVIDDAGLVTPDALQVVAGAAREDLPLQGAGWGLPADLHADASAWPVDTGIRFRIVALVGLPWAFLVGAVGWRLAGRLAPRCANLSMLGASRRDLRLFLGISARRLTWLPTIAGAASGILLVGLAGPRGWLGLHFYPPGVLTGALIAGTAIVAQLALLRTFAQASLRRAATDPYRARHRFRLGPVRVAGAAVSVSGGLILALLLARWWIRTEVSPPVLLFNAFFLACAVLIAGVCLGVGQVLSYASSALRDAAPLALLIGARRAAHDVVGARMFTAAMATLSCIFMFSAAVTTLIAAYNAVPGDDRWTVSTPSNDIASISRVLDAVAPNSVAWWENEGGGGVMWGTCAALGLRYGPLSTTSGDQCADRAEYGSGMLVASPVDVDGMQFTTEFGDVLREPVDYTVFTVDPASASGEDLSQGRDEAAGFYVTTQVSDVDAMQTRILRVLPVADFTMDAGNTQNRVLLPAVSRVETTSVILGLSCALMVLLLYALGTVAVSDEGDRLRILGASRTAIRRVAAAQTAVTSIVGGGLSVLAGWLCGQGYLAMASFYQIDLVSVVTLGALLLVFTGLASLASLIWPRAVR